MRDKLCEIRDSIGILMADCSEIANRPYNSARDRGVAEMVAEVGTRLVEAKHVLELALEVHAILADSKRAEPTEAPVRPQSISSGQ